MKSCNNLSCKPSSQIWSSCFVNFMSILIKKKSNKVLHTTVQIWPQCPELVLFSEMEKDSPLKLTFEIRPNAPDVLALPTELVCDPCQNCSCQQESTPATGLLSANDFFNCIRKWSKLPNEAFTFEKNSCHDVILLHKNTGISRAFSSTNLEYWEQHWKFLDKSQNVLRSLDRTSLCRLTMEKQVFAH